MKDSLIRLDLGNANVEADAFAGRQPGDTVTLKIKVKIDELTPSDFSGSIDEVEVLDGETAPENEEEQEPGEEAEGEADLSVGAAVTSAINSRGSRK